MALLPTASVQKLKDGLYRVLWNLNRYGNQAFNYSSKVEFCSLDVDECYEIKCSMGHSYVYGCSTPSVQLTFTTFDEDSDNFKQRKVTARFLGFEKEMRFSSYLPIFPLENMSSIISGVEKKCYLIWTAEWTEIPTVGCLKCKSSLGTAETFEILIDMGPTKSLKKGQESVLSHLSHLWESKTLADVTFKCEDKEIKAHTLIVSSGSPVLAAMFQNEFEEKQEKIVTIKEIKASVFEKLLYFIYTGDFDLKFEDKTGLLVAADMYNVTSLKNECDLYLSKNVTSEEAINYLIISHFHNAEQLFKASLNYLQQYSKTICTTPDWMSLLKNYPELGYIAMQFILNGSVAH